MALVIYPCIHVYEIMVDYNTLTGGPIITCFCFKVRQLRHILLLSCNFILT